MQKLHHNNLVAQSNLIIESRYAITKNEQLLLLAMVSLINPKDKIFTQFQVTTAELSKILDVHPATALREFDKITDRLLKRVFTIMTDKGWKKFQWVSYAEVKGDSVLLRFHDELKPYLLELKKTGHFTQYRLGIAVNFRSIYTIRIYQILKEYCSKRIHSVEFSLDEFKNMMLGEDSKHYPMFKRFKARIIITAQKELKEIDKKTGCYKSDLSFDLETRRTGRKISHLIFTIKTQQTKPIKTIGGEVTQRSSNTTIPQILQDYEALGIMRKMVQPYLDQRGEQALVKTLNKFHDDKQNGKITKSEQGYLAYLLRVNAGQEATQEKERELKQQNEKQLKEKAAQEQALKVHFEQERETALNAFFETVSDEEQDYITLDFEASTLFGAHIKASPVLFDLYQNYGMEDHAIKNCFNAFIIDKYLDKMLNDFPQWKEKNADLK